jgi:hypothetical protein
MTSLRSLVVTVALALQFPAAAPTEPTDDLKELDRLNVYGSQPEPWALRQAPIEAEDRFFERYNKLNSNDDFDVRCRVEARTGTRLTTRTCRPLYQEEAVRQNAKQAIEIRQAFESRGGYNQGLSPPTPAASAIMARRPAFEQHMRTVVRESPELIFLLQQRAAAAEALEAAKRRGGDQAGPARPTADQSQISGE